MAWASSWAGSFIFSDDVMHDGSGEMGRRLDVIIACEGFATK